MRTKWWSGIALALAIVGCEDPYAREATVGREADVSSREREGVTTEDALIDQRAIIEQQGLEQQSVEPE